jgi:protein-S-isoprenylcysteine O-methyltransferase Ste14
MNLAKILPPVWFLLSVITMIGLDRFFPVRELFNPSIKYIGILPIILGISIVLYCAYIFRQKGTTIKPFEESTSLLTDGLFRYSRNPIYSSMVVALLGIWLVLGSLTPLMVIPIFLWLIQEKFIKQEELMLEDKFGQEYKSYQNKVRRWI